MEEKGEKKGRGKSKGMRIQKRKEKVGESEQEVNGERTGGLKEMLVKEKMRDREKGRKNKKMEDKGREIE